MKVNYIDRKKNISDKRQQQLTDYHIKKREFAKNNRYNMKCFLCGKKIEIPNREPDPEQWFDFHHIYGERENSNLIKAGYYKPVHRKCHNEYHNEPVRKIAWFGLYLNKIKSKYPLLYQKERKRYDK